jgi:hypothetical protein
MLFLFLGKPFYGIFVSAVEYLVWSKANILSVLKSQQVSLETQQSFFLRQTKQLLNQMVWFWIVCSNCVTQLQILVKS